MLKIQSDRVIIDGHEPTKEQCETMTLLANALAESNNFKTVKYESGYAEFEKVGKAEELKFPTPGAPSPITVIFDSHITKVVYHGPNDIEFTTSGESGMGTAHDGAEYIFTVTLETGYVLDTVTLSDATPDYGTLVVKTDTTFTILAGVGGINQTITLTSKQSTSRLSVDLTTLPGWASLSTGSHSITIVAKADGYRDSEPSAAVSVEKAAPKTLEESTWAEIAQVSANKSWDAMGWKVGDTKTITLNGTVGTVALNNYQCKVYILGFDHNADREGQGISFGMLEGLDGVQLCLVDGNYNTITSSATAFTMNTSNTNNGGWKNCHMRNTILGSTDIANGDATSAAITNPASGTLMAALPSDLRTVMKPITKYTNNVGNSSEASAITPTVDYLPLLSEYEVFKSTTRANTNEATYQAQYQYYTNGKSKVKYQYIADSKTAYWWLRSPNGYDSSYFCVVFIDGTISSLKASISYGVAPVFLV